MEGLRYLKKGGERGAMPRERVWRLALARMRA